MKSVHFRLLAAAALALGAAACDDSNITSTGSSELLSGAFAYSLVGFENTPTSFDGGAVVAPWMPVTAHHQAGGDGLAGPGHRGPGGMMGGIGIPFLGGGPFFGFGRGLFGDGHLDANCAFNSASGRLDCPAVTHNGITVTRSVAYATAAGAVQQKFDTVTTDRINTRVTVAGTLTRRDSSTTVVNHAGERTVTGVAKGSTQVTINGASAGRETTNGKDATGAFTALRVQGDTTKNVVIPVATGTLNSPKSGNVIRVMTVTVTRGGTATSSSRREVVTYNGTDTASVVITKDGTTTTCKLPLKGRHGPPSCS